MELLWKKRLANTGVDKIMGFLKKHYPVFIMITIAIILWDGYVRVFHIEKYLLPTPFQVLKALFDQWHIIFSHTLITLYEAIAGFLIAIICSILLAIIIDTFQFFKRGFYPILVTSQTIPIITIAPLITMWFGFGILPKILVVTLVAFFPIVINLIDGLNSADKGLIDLLRTMNASNWQILLKVRFPSALPYFFSGMRIAATYSVMGAIIGEWLGASKGLGNYIRNSTHSFLAEQVFAAIIVIVASSILFYGFILLLESKIIPWNKQRNN